MVSPEASGPREPKLTRPDDPNSNEAVRNLVMDHTNSAIFQRNYLSRMIRYDTQAAYGGTAPRTELIQAANRMSRRIDPRRPKELTEAQSASIRQEEEIQELRGRRDELFQRIRHQFTFIYRAERELMKQIQKEYDAVAPVQDMRAQLEGDVESLSPILSTSGRVRYAFVERSRIVKAFFDPLSTCGAEDDMDWRVSIVDDMVSLCIRQEGVFRKARRIRRIQARESDLDDAERPLNAVKSESESDSSISYLFPVRCKPYQCLYCLGDTDLPLEERVHNLGSKYSLQRHFDRRHPFRPREPCPFPHPECAAVTLDSVMHFKNHAATAHGIYISDKI